MDLKTTTRPKRRSAQFRQIRDLVLPPPDGRALEVAEVGPGLAVRYLGRLAEEGLPGWDLVKRLESGVRRIPMPDACFENYETLELKRALGGIPSSLTVIDVNPRVVRIIARRQAGVVPIVADLAIWKPGALVPLFARFDLVVAFAVLGRVPSGSKDVARANIGALVKPDGVLLMDDDPGAEFMSITGFTDCFRRRPAAGHGPVQWVGD